jgi:hypothetical protein
MAVGRDSAIAMREGVLHWIVVELWQTVQVSQATRIAREI